MMRPVCFVVVVSCLLVGMVAGASLPSWIRRSPAATPSKQNCDYFLDRSCEPPTGPRMANPPAKCCNTAKNNKDKCMKYLYTGKQMRNCFGASGDDCMGVPQLIPFAEKLKSFASRLDLSGLEKVATSVMVKKLDNGVFQVPTSVGSIYHDSCCLSNPNGFFCNKYNQPFTSIVEPSLNDCPCAREWRKAVWALFATHWWYTNYTGDGTTDLTPVGKPLHPTILPLGPNKWDKQASSYGFNFVKATKALRAPPGTRLDCPGTDKRCRLGFLTFSEEADDVGRAEEVKQSVKRRIQSRLTQLSVWFKSKVSQVTATFKRWFRRGNKTPPSHEEIKKQINKAADAGEEDVEGTESGGIEAGDSAYCASGKFKSIHFRISLFSPFRRYGICL